MTVKAYYASNTPPPAWMETESAKLPISGLIAIRRVRDIENWSPIIFQHDEEGNITVRKISDMGKDIEYQGIKMSDFKYSVRAYGISTG